MKRLPRWIVASIISMWAGEASASERLLETSCSSNTDCDNSTEYCVGGICQTFGYCRTLADCWNPANDYPEPEIDCIGYMQCNNASECELFCGPECPYGLALDGTCNDCFEAACQDPGPCVNYNCGTCQAVFFSADGEVACGEISSTCSTSRECATGHYCSTEGNCLEFSYCDSTVDCIDPDNLIDYITCVGETYCGPEDGLCYKTCFVYCDQDTDCDMDTEFCSGGICREQGTCQSVLDCQNPSNVWDMPECEGYRVCNEGSCGIVCDGLCPPDKDESTCEVAPCEAQTCSSAVSCFDDYCEGCESPIFFTAQGEQTCVESSGEGFCARKDCDARNFLLGRLLCQLANQGRRALCIFS